MLIKTIEELRMYLRFPTSNVASKMPAFELAEEQYLIPVLGEGLYAELQTKYDANDMDEWWMELLVRCQAVIAPMGYLSDLPFLQANLSDNGIMVMEPEETRKAYKWEFNELVSALNDRGYSAIELLIVFLRDNRVKFLKWEDAPYNDPDNFHVIRDGAEFGKFVAIQQPHRCYLTMKPLFLLISEFYIIPTIGGGFYRHFNDRIIEGDLSEKEKMVFKYLGNAISRLVMMQACDEMSIEFSGRGFTVADKVEVDSYGSKKDVSEGRLNRLKENMKRTGNAFLELAFDYLVKEGDDDDFVVFRNSDVFPKEIGRNIRDDGNRRRRGFVVF